MVDGKTILITGCGSLAKALAQHMLLNAKPKKIILFSRNEYLQMVAATEIPDPTGRVRYFIGDIRDSTRLELALRGVDIVIHTAALKRVDTVEYNPEEAVETNVEGTRRVMRACVGSGVQQAMFISTDKAVMPINLYGCTKAVGEKLWLAANFYRPIFNVVRYGNVMGSRGSVLPLFRAIAKKKEEFPVTDVYMTRFWVTMERAVEAVMEALNIPAGNIMVPDCPTFKITDLAKALYVRAKIKEVGARPGEKIHEMLIGPYESKRTREEKDYYLIDSEVRFSEGARPKTQGILSLTSDKGNMLQAEIRELLKEG